VRSIEYWFWARNKKMAVTSGRNKGRSAVSISAEDESFIGRVISKEFKSERHSGEGAFKGTVVAYDPVKQLHQICYEDGDEEELTLTELQVVLLPRSKSASGAASRPFGMCGVEEPPPQGMEVLVQDVSKDRERRAIPILGPQCEHRFPHAQFSLLSHLVQT
jgi:hypothetical protein